MKYTRAGIIAVSLRALETLRDDALSVELVIQDTGIGMSDDFLASDLYTPYRQADPNTVGTGLGLSIVKQLAQDLRATLDVQSKLDKGTRVAMTLDVKLATVKSLAENAEDDDKRLMESAAHGGPSHFHWYTSAASTQGSSSRGAQAVGRSAMRTASAWLHSNVTTGSYWTTNTDGGTCAITERELLHIAESQPEAFLAALTELALRNTRLVVLSCSMYSVSLAISFENLPVSPTYVHQP